MAPPADLLDDGDANDDDDDDAFSFLLFRLLRELAPGNSFYYQILFTLNYCTCGRSHRLLAENIKISSSG